MLAGAQALAPASAAAESSSEGCLHIVVWPFVSVAKDCMSDGSGAGETIIVEDTKPEPNRSPSGPGHDRSVGEDSGRLGAGPRGGGGNSGAVRKPSKVGRPLSMLCKRYARNIKTFYSDSHLIARRKLGFWEWFLGSDVQTDQFEAIQKAWTRDGCPGPVPDESD